MFEGHPGGQEAGPGDQGITEAAEAGQIKTLKSHLNENDKILLGLLEQMECRVQVEDRKTPVLPSVTQAVGSVNR